MTTKAAEAEDQEQPQTEAPDGPVLDMSDVGVRKMIAKAKARGYVTYDELNKVLPSDKSRPSRSKTPWRCSTRWASTSSKAKRPRKARRAPPPRKPRRAHRHRTPIAKAETKAEPTDRTDDPVRMYLREMGSVELLSREGEIAIAKRIEAGREVMIGACAKAR